MSSEEEQKYQINPEKKKAKLDTSEWPLLLKV
jgi:hypothetical protein